jgi:hypothetical protein
VKNGEGEVKLVPEEGKEADSFLHSPHHQQGDNSTLGCTICSTQLRSRHEF